MNRTYRLVWSAIHRTYVPAAETSRSAGKKGSTLALAPLVLAVQTLMAGPAFAQACDPAVATGGALSVSGVQLVAQTCSVTPFNSLSVAAGGTITPVEPNSPGVVSQGSNTFILNSGSITGIGSGDGVRLTKNGAAAESALVLLSNTGTINGGSTGTGIRIVGIDANYTMSTGITNTGTVQGATAGLSADRVTIGNFVNSGTIRGTDATSRGVGVTATTGSSSAFSFSNLANGLITGGDTGLFIGAGVSIGSALSNAGTISGGATAGLETQSSLSSGVSNSGTIKGTGASGDGLVVHGTTANVTVSTISNATTGTISGNSGLRVYGTPSTGDINSFPFTAAVSNLTNSGEISGITRSGVRIDSQGSIGPIRQSDTGRITGLTNGIEMVSGGGSGLISNGGLISGTNGSGILIGDGSVLNGNVSNSGTISGLKGDASAGIMMTAVQRVSRIQGSIDNSGTIAGGIVLSGNSTITGAIRNNGGTIGGIRIGNQASVDGNIFSSGVINGDVELNGNAQASANRLTIQGSNAAITGNTTGNLRSGVTVDGTFASGGTFNVGTFRVGSGSEFTMGHNVAVQSGEPSAFFNSGKVVIPAGSTVTVSGNYFQQFGSTLQINVSSPSSYGKLVVTGTAKLSGDGDEAPNPVGPLHVNAAGAEDFAYLLAGGTQTGVLTAGTLALPAGGLRVTDNSALFKFVPTVVGNRVDLCIARDGAAECLVPAPAPAPAPAAAPAAAPPPAPGITVLNSAQSQGFTPGFEMAKVLDDLIDLGLKTPEPMKELIARLATLPTQAAIVNALLQMVPVVTGTSAQVNSAALRVANRVIQARQEANRGLSSGDGLMTDRQVWVKPLGSWARQSDSGPIAGYKAASGGLILGADAGVSPALRVGGSFAYTHTKVDGNSAAAPQTLAVDSYRVIGYGSYSLNERTDVNFQADVGTNTNSSQRSISFGGVSSVAAARYRSLATHIGVGLGTTVALSPATTVTPSVRLDWSHVTDNGYTETGAGALNLAVQKNTSRELVLFGEAKVNHTLPGGYVLSGNFGAGYDTIAKRSALAASFAGGGAQFITFGPQPSRWLTRTGLGVTKVDVKGMELTGRYDLETRSGFRNHTVSLRARMPF